ncbi:MAG: transcription elongation factor GreA [Chloroflexi bacterium]|nr:transcription elongation factor GreA [Chloroflexota bacterium]
MANYSEQYYISTTKSPDNLNFIKIFLAYAQKQSFISSNLAVHIRVKKLPSKSVSHGTTRAEEPVLLTGQGYTELIDRLTVLKSERPIIADEIRKAAADKDFRENAPLEAAREQLGHLEGQIRELEDTLKRAKIAEAEQESNLKAYIGDTVTLEDKTSGDKVKLTLVGSREANVKQGKISVISPMGQALFNKEIGESVNVNAPSGVISYSILDIIRE